MQELVLKKSVFRKLSSYVRRTCGINLHEGKKTLLKARRGKILLQRDIPSFKEYYNLVINDKSGYELLTLLNAISTNLTSFFREPDHFDFLKRKILSEIAKNNGSAPYYPLRIWSAGCSSGEEPYSLAITVHETLYPGHWVKVRILATDLSTRVLEMARTGIYETEKIKNIPHDLKRKYFLKGENRWKGYVRVKKEVREMVHFQRINFMDDFHFRDPFHIIFCRNVMIYFNNQTKETVVGKFCRYLAREGYLFIGHAESLTGIIHPLKYIQPSIFRKL